MKRYISILVAVLAMFSVLPLSAQQTQDALYIFRNDGQFSSFFFGDIDRIEYSKIDTLGVEQADYVVQEVYALDSVFRIPISAIDSVAFVTPETKYKEGVIKIEENLRNFVTAVDSLTLTLAANTPENIVPKVGDKLTMLEVNDIFPYGFAGIVANVENNGNGYTVTCEAAALTDLFERIVIKGGAECGEDLAQSRKTNRAMINGEYVKKIDLPTYTKNLSFTQSLGVGPFSADVSATMSTSYQLQFWHRFCLYMDLLEGTYYSHFSRTQHTDEFAINLAGSLTAHINAPIVIVPVPLGQPFIRLDLYAGLFFEGQGSINTGFKITDVSREMNETRYSNSLFDGRDVYLGVPSLPENIRHEESWQKLSGKVQLSTGIYVDLAFVCLLKDVASISYTHDRGVRLEIESDLRAEDFDLLYYSDSHPSDATKLYSFLDREGTMKESFFMGSQISAKGIVASTTGRKEYLLGNQPVSGSFVPHFSNPRVEPDPKGDNSMAKYSVDISGKTFGPHRLGYICYDDDEYVVDKDFLDDPYENGKPNTMTMWIKNLKPGQKYIVYPRTDIDNPFGDRHCELVGNPALEFTGFRSVADLVVFDKNVEYYNSEYCLGFSDYNDGHYFYLYKQREKGSTSSDRCLAGYYTADNSKMEITLTEVASKSGGQENPFYKLGLRSGDVIIATYSQTDGAFVLNIGGISLSLKEGIKLKGTWKTLDGLAEFDFTFGRYRCNGNLYLTTSPIVNQFEQTIKFRIHWVYDTTTEKAESCKITLPTGEEMTIDCKDYIVPYTVETKDGVKYLSFELFGYPFVLTKTGD